MYCKQKPLWGGLKNETLKELIKNDKKSDFLIFLVFFKLFKDSVWILHHAFQSHLSPRTLTSTLCPCNLFHQTNKNLTIKYKPNKQTEILTWKLKCGTVRTTVHPLIHTSFLVSLVCLEASGFCYPSKHGIHAR